MSKLYIFAIGGTGARVLKSLAFLLATGVELNATKVIPIIIDPDEANGDVSLTQQTLKNYQKVRSFLSFDSNTKNKFFNTEIDSVTDNFRNGVQSANLKFKDFIGFDSLDKTNKALTSLLFSQKNLDTTMDVGFKGNPNMGSVVLNQFQTSDDFKKFASSFSDGDKIFIISSIFGGTGASGFPLLLKNLREASHELDNFALLQDANIGAISVLPYFGVKKDAKSEIDKSTFISKTKAALHYYEHGVNNSVNTMYYIGDDLSRDYDNHEGSTAQKNDAHFIELASALAIVDFANSPKAKNNVKEFGVDKKANDITFRDLNEKTRNRIFNPLTQYYLLNLFLLNEIKNSLDQRYAIDLSINKEFLNSEFYQELQKFNNEFRNWLKQMSINQRGFSPFTLEFQTNNIFDSVKGIPLKNGGLLQSKNYDRFISFLNSSLKEISKGDDKNKKFMEAFYNATQSLVTKQ